MSTLDVTAYWPMEDGPPIGDGPWEVTSSPTASSVDLQPCGGAIPNTNCTDPSGAAVTDDTVDLNGNSQGGLGQTVSTTPGQSYELVFDLTGNPADHSCTYDQFTGNV